MKDANAPNFTSGTKSMTATTNVEKRCTSNSSILKRYTWLMLLSIVFCFDVARGMNQNDNFNAVPTLKYQPKIGAKVQIANQGSEFKTGLSTDCVYQIKGIRYENPTSLTLKLFKGPENECNIDPNQSWHATYFLPVFEWGDIVQLTQSGCVYKVEAVNHLRNGSRTYHLELYAQGNGKSCQQNLFDQSPENLILAASGSKKSCDEEDSSCCETACCVGAATVVTSAAVVVPMLACGGMVCAGEHVQLQQACATGYCSESTGLGQACGYGPDGCCTELAKKGPIDNFFCGTRDWCVVCMEDSEGIYEAGGCCDGFCAVSQQCHEANAEGHNCCTAEGCCTYFCRPPVEST